MYFNKPKPVSTSMDFDDDMNFYHRSRKVKIFINALLLLLTVMGAIGFFGYGPWTEREVESGKGMKVSYEHFLRVTKETPLTITLAAKDSIWFSINDNYLQKVQLIRVSPEPLKVISSPGEHIFCFAGNAVPGNQHVITLYTTAEKAGKAEGIFKYTGGQSIIYQFIYP